MEQIMNQTDVKVSFYLKKSEADARGNCPVMARLIVGKHSETAFSVKFRVPQSLWSSGRACGKSVAARDINNRLDEIRAAALGIYAEQSAIREDVTAEDVKHQLLGMASEQETLLSYFRLFIRNFEKRVGINRTEKTLRASSTFFHGRYSASAAVRIIWSLIRWPCLNARSLIWTITGRSGATWTMTMPEEGRWPSSGNATVTGLTTVPTCMPDART